MVGIRDVANLAGVSKSTVSIVINGRSEEKYQKKHRKKYYKL